METQLILDNIDNYDDIKSNTTLDKLFSESDNFHFNDFLYFESPLSNDKVDVMDLVYSINKEINSREYLDHDSKEYVEFWVSIFKSGFNRFKNGIINRDLVSFLLFLITNSFLKLDINYLIKDKSYESKFNILLEALASEIGQINMTKMNLEIYPEYEKIFSSQNLEFLDSAYMIIKLDKRQELIKYSKIIISDLILNLILFLKEHNIELFKRIILKLDNMLSITLFVKLCSFEDIVNIYTENVIINELLLFCFLKKILDEDYDYIKKYNIIVKKILIQILKSNKKIFYKLMLFFNNNLLFNEVLGSFICDLSQEDIKLIINEFNWIFT